MDASVCGIFDLTELARVDTSKNKNQQNVIAYPKILEETFAFFVGGGAASILASVITDNLFPLLVSSKDSITFSNARKDPRCRARPTYKDLYTYQGKRKRYTRALNALPRAWRSPLSTTVSSNC
jgi:hypothetical protein